MFPRSSLQIALLLLLLGTGLAPPAHAGTPYPAAVSGQEPIAVAGITKLRAGQTGIIELTIVVPPGFHVYKDMVDVQVLDPGDLSLGAPSLPAGVLNEDPAAPGMMREQYDFDAIVEVPVTRPPSVGSHPVTLDVRWQACRASTCLFPRTEKVVATVLVDAAG